MNNSTVSTDRPETDHSQPDPIINSQGQRLVNLNQADQTLLTTLPGIGPGLAQRIIDYREQVQPFAEPVEVTAVPGISERMYRQFAEQVTVSAPAELPDLPQPSSQKAAEPETVDNEEGYLIVTGEEEPVMDDGVDEEKEEAGYKLIWGDEADPGQASDKPAEEMADHTPLTQPSDKSNFRRPWILMVVGALLGTFIALLTLYSINGGTLMIANHPTILELDLEVERLKQREQTLSETIGTMQETLSGYEALATQIDSQKAELEILRQSQDSLTDQAAALEAAQAELRAESATLSEQVDDLEQAAATTQETILQIQQDTGRFNNFLSGLQALMLNIQNDTGAAADDGLVTTPTVTPEPSPTRTPRSTLTPSPTATTAASDEN